MDVIIDKFGRVLIPKPIRKLLGIGAGSELKLEVRDESGDRSIYLTPTRDQPLLVREDDLLVYSGRLEEEDGVVEFLIRTDREDRNRRVGGSETGQ